MLTSERGLVTATSSDFPQLFALAPNPDQADYLPPNASDELKAAFRKRKLADHWIAVRSHPAYLWMNDRVEFWQAWEFFQRKKALTRAVALRTDEADFRFVACVAFGLMTFAQQSDPANRRRLPSKREAESTIRHIKGLLEAELHLLKLSPTMVQELDVLERQLQETLKRRKEKEDATYAHRRFVQALTWQFLNEFGQTFHVGVRELCGLIDYFPGETTLQETISEVRLRRQRLRLAEAISRTPVKKA